MKGKNNAGSKKFPASIKEEETHRPEEPRVSSTREKEKSLSCEDLEGDKPPPASLRGQCSRSEDLDCK